jgi:hypothetical protein
MAWYEIGFQTTATANAAPIAALRAPTRTSRLWEAGFSCNAATASGLTVYRNTAGGYTATTSTSVGQATNPLWAAGTSLVDTAWSTPPTVTAASRYRRMGAPAAIGAAWVWTFRDGLWVRSATATDNVVFWNETGGAISVLNGYCVWEE